MDRPRTVTNHALLRYLQRVEKIDTEAFDNSFSAMRRAGYPVVEAWQKLAAIAEKMQAVGARKIVQDGFEFIMDGGVIVTVSMRHSSGVSLSEKGKARNITRRNREARLSRMAIGAERGRGAAE